MTLWNFVSLLLKTLYPAMNVVYTPSKTKPPQPREDMKHILDALVLEKGHTMFRNTIFVTDNTPLKIEFKDHDKKVMLFPAPMFGHFVTASHNVFCIVRGATAATQDLLGLSRPGRDTATRK